MRLPADDDYSAGQDQPKPRLLRGRKLFSKADRSDQGNEQRHAPGIERARIVGGGKAQPGRRHQRIRRACPGNDRRQSKPSKAIVGKASPHEHRRQEETRYAEAQRRVCPTRPGWS